jgi:hypothetical protein
MTSSKFGLRVACQGTDNRRIPVMWLLRALITIGLSGLPLLAASGAWQAPKNPPPIPEIIDPATKQDFGPGGAAAPLGSSQPASGTTERAHIHVQWKSQQEARP